MIAPELLFNRNKILGRRVQKISLDASFSCPNREGSRTGCLYCLNEAFLPFYASRKYSIDQQIKKGRDFLNKKYAVDEFLGYFGAYSSTYASLPRLKELYGMVLSYPFIKGLIISTRPDCINPEILGYLRYLSEEHIILLELGIESFSEESLRFIKRGHSVRQSIDAMALAKEFGITLGCHLIFGLPFETAHAEAYAGKVLSDYEVDYVKLHQLQIIRGAALSELYEKDQNIFHLLGADEYCQRVSNFLEHLDERIILDRIISEVPEKYLIAPRWGGLKTSDIIKRVSIILKGRGTRQGSLRGSEKL